MTKEAKSKALNRKKEERMTENTCKHCKGKHSTADHKEGGGEDEGKFEKKHGGGRETKFKGKGY